MYFKRIIFFSVVLFALLFNSAFSANFTPQELKPWEKWVLYNHKELQCPLSKVDKKRVCVWPSSLEINLSGQNASFIYKVFIFKKSFVELPGNKEIWPVELEVNGKPESAIDRAGSPYIFLTKGYHEIKGKLFLGTSKSFHIPRETALLELFIEGKRVEEPQLDTKNWLLFLTPKKGHSNVEIPPKKEIKFEIFRLLIDDVPFKIESVIRMSVSGQPREIVLKHMIPEGFIPIKAHFPFKWAFDKDGNLHLQVRPGIWEFTYVLANPSHIKKVSYWNKDKRLLKPEIWSFKENPSIRRIEIEGATPIDPSQTDMPSQWKNFPAYFIKKGSALILNERQRGDEKRPPNDLTLNRIMWLGFNGDAYYLKDEISGKINRNWRINAINPLKLGRVVVDGVPRLITKDNKGKAGVEVRNRSIHLEAEGEIKDNINKLDGLGWEEEFSSANIKLFLPPGWSVLAAFGADVTKGTIIDKWSLLDLFLLLLLSWASFKCFGILGAIFMFLFLLLGIHDEGVPIWVWFYPIIAEALLKIVKKDSTIKFIKSCKFISIVWILILLLPFSVKSIKCAIYPQLCQEVSSYYPTDTTSMLSTTPPPIKERLKGRNFRKRIGTLGSKDKAYYQEEWAQFSRKLDFEPDTKIQTGPGLPNWQGKRVELSWSGPVSSDQRIRFHFISPILNFVLGLIKGVAPIFLLLVMSNILASSNIRAKNLIVNLTLISILIFTFLPSIAHCAFPSQKILEELEKRLTSPPECYPDCTSIESTVIKARNDKLELRFMIKSLSDSTMRLPINLENWQPEGVFLQKEDGTFKQVPIKRDKNGYLILAAYKGRLNVVVYGKLKRDIILPVPFILHNVRVVADEKTWKISGIDTHLNVKSQIKIVRVKKELIDKKVASSQNTLQPKARSNGIPAFLDINRTFDFSLKWKISTTIKRISDYRGPIQFVYKLLPGERIISSGINVENGRAKIVLRENQQQLYFESVLNKVNSLSLEAPYNPLFVETWRIRFSSIWHINFSGIPEIVSHLDRYEPVWKPWPGEKLHLSIFKPEPVKGPLKTVKSCTLIQKPGPRLTDSTLKLQILSSIGTTQKITLLPESRPKSILVDGKNIPFDPENNELDIPLHPGITNIELKWIEKRGITTLFKTTSLNFGLPLTNIKVELIYPQNRWPLFVKGPIMGPAVLFWGAFFLTILFGIILGRVKQIPISSFQWIILGAGLLPVEPLTIVPVFGAILLLHLRGLYWERLNSLKPIKFNIIQLLLILCSIIAFLTLIYALQNGLLGTPNMQIMGGGSYPGHLFWYQDKAERIPACIFVSTSIWAYRAAMLFWAMWLVRSIINWIPWLWSNFHKGESWKRIMFNLNLRLRKDKEKKS